MAMEKKYIIVVNIGSTSKKYALYLKNEQLFIAHFEWSNGNYLVNGKTQNKNVSENISKTKYDNAFSYFLKISKSLEIIQNYSDIQTAGIRIVAPGTFFTEHKKINSAYIQKLKNAERTSPLHTSLALSEIQQIQNILPKVKIYGISDSVFHKDMPKHARIFALPSKDTRKYDLYRFGYHGISVQSVVREAQKSNKALIKKSIVCHLGGGSSLTAIKNGASIDTTMGFTPDSGIPMSTRIGAIDALAVMSISKKIGGIEKLPKYLNMKSGLLGISELSSDMRDLLSAEEKGDQKSKDAIEVYIYHIRKNIGSLAASLEGLDSLIFTGTIGERSDIIRSRICDSLRWIGVEIDNKKNHKTISKDGNINTESSQVKVLVIRSREISEMARFISAIQNKSI